MLRDDAKDSFKIAINNPTREREKRKQPEMKEDKEQGGDEPFSFKKNFVGGLQQLVVRRLSAAKNV